MGDAKRRRKVQKEFTRIDSFTSELVQIRPTEITAQEFSAQQRKMVEQNQRGERLEGFTVPCNGCRACCFHPRIDLKPEEERPEDLTHLSIDRDEEGFFLRKREDGACVHLGEHGCTVYAHRPQCCRIYDCRLYALVGARDTFDNGQQSPAWEFPAEDPSDKIFMTALRMGILPDVEAMFAAGKTKIGMTAHEMMLKASEHLEENLKRAAKLVAFLELLGPLIQFAPFEIVRHIESTMELMSEETTANLERLMSQGVESVQTHRNDRTRKGEIAVLLMMSTEILRRTGYSLPLSPSAARKMYATLAGEAKE